MANSCHGQFVVTWGGCPHEEYQIKNALDWVLLFSRISIFGWSSQKNGTSYQGEGPARLLKEVGGTSGEVETQGLLLDVGLAGGSGI